MSVAARFRKLPVEVEAAQYPGFAIEESEKLEAFLEWLSPLAEAVGRWPLKFCGRQLIIPTMEGDIAANPGDWIVRGVAGEVYPVDREIFAQTYVRAQG